MTTNNAIKSATIKGDKLTVTLEFDVTALTSGNFAGIKTADSGNFQLFPKRYATNVAGQAGLSMCLNLVYNPNAVTKADTKNQALQALLASGMAEDIAKNVLGIK